MPVTGHRRENFGAGFVNIRMATTNNPYGDGTAAEKIVQFLAARLSAA